VKLYDLLDILTEIESVMLNSQYATLFSYYNSSSGVIPIVSKLPHFLQEKWKTLASSYERFLNPRQSFRVCPALCKGQRFELLDVMSNLREITEGRALLAVDWL
jgi:hypothetical protein